MSNSGKFPLKVMIVLLLAIPLYQNCGNFKANVGAGFQSLGSSKFQCDPSVAPKVSNTRRLTKTEYLNTVNDLIKTLTPADQSTFQTFIQSELDLLPDDNEGDKRFSENANYVSPQLTEAFINIGLAIGEFIAANNTRLTGFVGACASGGEVDAACVSQFAGQMGKKIFRRPLTTEEIQSINTDLQAYADSTAKWLLARMFSSPHFFMHIEDTKNDLGNGLYEISDYALANRISYFLLDTMPDDELFAAAENGDLATDAGVISQIQRLDNSVNHQALAKTMASFFKQWIKTDEAVLPDPQENLLMQNFAAGDTLTLQSVENEIDEMIQYYTLTNPGNFYDLFTSDISFAVDPDLAKIYQVPVWNGDPNQLVRFPAGERSGLLTRSAFLVNQGSLSKPITRGIHIRHDILCDPLPSPPPEIFEMRALDFDPDLTTRERITNKTADPTCMGCHSKINHTGFALENYDSFGRFRDQERIFDPNTGTLAQTHPIDPISQPNITPELSSQSFSNPNEYSQAIAHSGAAERCFVQTFYEYAYHQYPSPEANGCELERMRASVTEEGGSLKKLLLEIPASRQFRLKSVTQ